jgi:hypothetical protein
MVVFLKIANFLVLVYLFFAYPDPTLPHTNCGKIEFLDVGSLLVAVGPSITWIIKLVAST